RAHRANPHGPRRRLSQPGLAPLRLRSDLGEYPGSPAGADGARSKARHCAGRGCRAGGIVAPAGSVGAGGAPRSGPLARAPPGYRGMVDPGLAFRPEEARWAGSDRRQPATAEGEFCLTSAERHCGIARLDRLVAGLLVEALDDRRDVGAADADIGERAVVEHHQLAISPLARPPAGPAVAGCNEEIDERNGLILQLVWFTAKMGI